MASLPDQSETLPRGRWRDCGVCDGKCAAGGGATASFAAEAISGAALLRLTLIVYLLPLTLLLCGALLGAGVSDARLMEASSALGAAAGLSVALVGQRFWAARRRQVDC